MGSVRACRSGRHQYDHGRFKQCPDCKELAAVAWRANNPERAWRAQEEWRLRNLDKVRLAKKKYHDAHRAEHAARTKRDKARRWKEHPEMVKVQNIRQAAKHRELVYRLEDAHALDLVTDCCFYCGAAPNPVNGIDRVDNTKGYEEDNVVTACMDCNLAKLNRTRTDFESWAKRVAVRAEASL